MPENENAGIAGAPATHPPLRIAPESGDLRAALVKIMEAIEDGDIDYAYAIADATLGLEEAA